LKSVDGSSLPHMKEIERVLSEHLSQMGKVARISDISARITPSSGKVDQSRIAFLANLSSAIAVIDDNDHFYHAIGLAKEHGEKAIKDNVNKIIDAIKKIGEPTTIGVVAEKVGNKDETHVKALASISKNIANLH